MSYEQKIAKQLRQKLEKLSEHKINESEGIIVGVTDGSYEKKLEDIKKHFTFATPASYPTDVEEALKNKDFSKYYEHMRGRHPSETKSKLEAVIQATTKLSSSFDQLIQEVRLYDPSLDLVQKIESEAQDAKDLMTAKLKEMILLRPKTERPTQETKNKIQTSAKDIENKSFLLESLKNDARKLSGQPKMTEEEARQARKAYDIRKNKRQIEKDAEDIYKYGKEYTDRELDNIKEAFEDPTKTEIVREATKMEMLRLEEKITKLKERVLIASDLLIIIDNTRVRDRLRGETKKQLDALNSNTKKVLSNINEFLHEDINNPINDFDDFLDSTEVSSKLSSFIEEIDEDIGKLERLFQEEDRDRYEIAYQGGFNVLTYEVKKMVSKINETLRDLYTLNSTAYEEKFIKTIPSALNRGRTANNATRALEYSLQLIEDLDTKKVRLSEAMDHINRAIKAGSVTEVMNTLRSIIRSENDYNNPNSVTSLIRSAIDVENIVEGIVAEVASNDQKRTERERQKVAQEEAKRVAEIEARREQELMDQLQAMQVAAEEQQLEMERQFDAMDQQQQEEVVEEMEEEVDEIEEILEEVPEEPEFISTKLKGNKKELQEKYDKSTLILKSLMKQYKVRYEKGTNMFKLLQRRIERKGGNQKEKKLRRLNQAESFLNDRHLVSEANKDLRDYFNEWDTWRSYLD